MRRTLLLCTTLMIIIFTGCSTVDPGPVASPGAPASTDPTNDPTPAPSPGASTAAAAQDGELTILFDDGNGATTTWTLTCDPAGGTHPDPDAACSALDANGATSLPAVAKDTSCTQIYGGPQTATITGTWRGQTVNSTLKRTNGCEIARWTALEGLLPTANS